MKKRHVAWLALCILPVACTSNPHPEGKPLPALTFNHIQTLPVNVARVDVLMNQVTAAQGFVLSPQQVAEDYFKNRYQPQGTRDALKVTINKATVTSAAKTAENRVGKFFNVGGQDVYDVVLDLTLQHVSDTGQVLYSRGVKATRTMNITQHASVAEREQHQFKGMETLFSELDNHIAGIIMNEMKLAR